MAARTLVVDNGAATIKFGFADEDTPYKTFANNITRSKAERKTFVGDQLETCKDFSGLYYRLPFEKGLLTSWDVEKQVWDRLFNGKIVPVCITRIHLQAIQRASLTDSFKRRDQAR